MKRISLAIACALLSAAAMLAQAPAKTTGAAGLGKPDPSANVDRNIRAYIELLRADVKTSKAQIMGEVMQLDTNEATKFWPIYKEFEAEYSRLGDQIVGVIKKYADQYENMTDAVAADLGDQVLSIEQQRNGLKKQYFDRMKKEVGAIIAVRFLQVENQLERVIDLQVAASLPIIER